MLLKGDQGFVAGSTLIYYIGLDSHLSVQVKDLCSSAQT
jgi:hypothetical protein